MKKKFSTHWKSSKQPRKQRKYNYNAPLHIKGKFLSAHLSKELRQKYRTRSIRLRKGDKVRIMRGQFRGKSGKVEKVFLRKTRVYIESVQIAKKDGTKAYYPIHPSNVMIMEIDLSDKKRKTKIEAKTRLEAKTRIETGGKK